MTRLNYTHISILLDRSGSMGSNGKSEEAINGFNTFIAEQKKLPGKVTVTVAQFDHEYDVLHDFEKLDDIPKLDHTRYQPRGMTALLDAFGRLMISTGAHLSSLPEHRRPDRVLFVVITDGQENNSKEMTASKVAEMVDHQRDKYSWAFVYLGADLKDFDKAGLYGKGGFTAYTASNGWDGQMYAFAYNVHTGAGVNQAYCVASTAANNYRSTGKATVADADNLTGAGGTSNEAQVVTSS